MADLTEMEKSRREFVKTAGKLAVYTTPIMMLLMKPSPNAIAASAGGPSQTQDVTSYSMNPNQQQNDKGFWLWRLLTFWD
jgi:hypothetical protein